MSSNERNSVTNWKHDADRQEFAIEALAMSVQFALQKAMNENCITQKQLAERLGVSPARVSQILAKDATNLTLKTIGRIADALGEEFELFSLRDINKLKARAKKGETGRFCKIITIPHLHKGASWVDTSAANDRLGERDLAFAVAQ
ncbi:helix-turn-helix domain-containing protein [Acidimangrovimonas pyrenivorans]|uniref:Helix-turn-helix domain-containing protein n=1 Tax=Acidimangrovimonas pyrenivorans TaxID=2030798 RepID=A0ABV7AFR3_9RHOB